MTTLNAYNEKALVIRLVQGDEMAFEQIYRLYAKRLMGNIIKLVKSETIAAEILQEVFVKLWFHREQIDPEKTFSSYLFRIAQNHVCDFFRKASCDSKLQAALMVNSKTGYVHIEEDICSKEEAGYLYQLIESLPPRRRAIFQLIKLEGLSYDEVSRRLNISKSTINDHIVKATKFIQEKLELQHTGLSISLLFLLL